MKKQSNYCPLSMYKKILITFGCMPLILFWVLGVIFPKEFRSGWAVYTFLILSIVIYLIVFRYISMRGKTYLFNSNQQLWHNYALFMPFYPIIYIWILEGILKKDK